jgi:hypothetical protein
MEMTSYLYRGRTTRRYLATTFSSGSGSPSVARRCTMPVMRKAKSSMASPSRRAMDSYSARRF